MSQSQSAGTALPCAACKQPVIEKRTADGALVVLDAATKRLHLCVKRKAEAKAKPPAPSRPAPSRPARPPRPPAKRVEVARPPAESRVRAKVARPARPARPERKEPPRRPKKTTLRSPQQVEEILKGKILRWRTVADSPTSFCAECSAPVLVGFSHVRWDVMMLDAVGHRPHDCATSRQATAALQRERPVDIPELPQVETARRVVRPAAPVAPSAPVEVAARPRRRPAGTAPRTEAANSCETCGKLKSLVNGEWVCLHC